MSDTPRLVVDEKDWRLVEVEGPRIFEHSIAVGERHFVLETWDGCDALGQEKWREFRTDNKTIRQVVTYLCRLAIKGAE